MINNWRNRVLGNSEIQLCEVQQETKTGKKWGKIHNAPEEASKEANGRKILSLGSRNERRG